MKKIVAIVAIITLALLASCTKKQSDEVVSVLTEPPAVETSNEVVVDTPETPVETPVEVVVEEEELEQDEVIQAIIETEAETPVALVSGQYSDYEASLVGSTDDTVLFFAAAWCPSCVAADKNISSGTVPDDLTILKVDFDNSADLRKKHGVTYQHTFVQVDAQGNLISKWSGGTTIDNIVSKLK